jgi:Flp pilus assembly protein TadG
MSTEHKMQPLVCGGRRPRKGTATAELAICLPAIVVLVMGALECTTMIFLKQSLQIAAYETVRRATPTDGDAATALIRGEQILTERQVAGGTVALTPPGSNTAPRGTPITATTTAPCALNSILQLRFFTGSLTGRAVMNKE